MTVEVSGSVNDDGTGSANSINVFSEVQGSVSNLNAGAGMFSVLGFDITATRIERKTPDAGDTLIKVRGQIANVTPSTFTIGTITVNYTAAQVSPNTAAIVNDAFVKVSSTSVATGNMVTASRVQVVGSRPFGFADGGKSELEGVVSDFISLSQFKARGIAVNACGSGVLFERDTGGLISSVTTW